MDTLYIVMPAYNEEENIEKVISDWYPMLSVASKESRMVIADSGSNDKTGQILEGLQTEYPKLELYRDCEKQHGPKLMALYKYACEKEADYIFQTDSDGQTSSEEFLEFWNERQNYSAVVGFRPVRGDGKSRAFVEKIVCILLRLIFGVKVPDANAPFRLMKTEVIKKYIDRLPEDYNIPNIMLTTYFAYYKEKVLFKKISFKPRQGGTNSINLSKITKIGMRAIGDFSKFKKEMKYE